VIRATSLRPSLRHAGGRDGAEARQEGVVLRVLAGDLGQRHIAELRVVAIIAERGGLQRRALQDGLVVLLEQRVLSRHAIGHGRIRAGDRRTDTQGQQEAS